VVGNGAAFGIGVGVGFGLSLARLGLWVTPLRPKTPKTRLVVMLVTTLLIPAVVAFSMPTFIAGLVVWLGTAAGIGIATPIVLPLAHLLFDRKRRDPLSSDSP
jgi:hypothetical protein